MFTSWSGGGCSGSAGCSFPVTAPTTVSARFDIPPPQTHALQVSRTGSGTVSSSPAGIDCGTTCLATYVANTPVDLTAAPAPGYVLGAWSGACSGTGPCRVTMSADRSVGVRFDVAPPSSYPLTIAKTGSGAGTVSSSPDGILCGVACGTSYAPGTLVTLAATPVAGAVFAGWSGGGCSGLDPCRVTMDVARSVTAAFAASSPTGPATVLLGTEVGGPGRGTVTANAGLGLSCAAATGGASRASPPRARRRSSRCTRSPRRAPGSPAGWTTATGRQIASSRWTAGGSRARRSCRRSPRSRSCCRGAGPSTPTPLGCWRARGRAASARSRPSRPRR